MKWSVVFELSLLYLISFATNIFAQNDNIAILDLEPESITPLDQLNSPFRETNPCLTPDGKYLFFMSGRGSEPWNDPEYTSYQGQQEADGDIFYCRKIDGQWMDPVNMGPSINSSMGEDEPNVTPDGQYVIFQSWKEGWDTTGGPYYKSELTGHVWGKPEGLGGNIHKFFMNEIRKNDWYYATDGSTLSPDGSVFIFASGKWYNEPMDLYISFLKNERWTYPKKMQLSTPADERSVFIAADSKTLFFSSSGYGGFGELDIFKTVIDEEGNHGNIINLGKAFNTEKNDFGFTMNVRGDEIYYTQDAELIQVTLSNPDQLLKPLPTLVINGIVTDYYGNPVEADIRIISKQNNRLVAKAKSNSISGEYSLALRKVSDQYVKEVIADNYQKFTETIDVKDLKQSSIIDDRDLLKRINSELIFFDLNESDIRKGEFNKLDSVINYIFNHKRSKILLTGHADQLGTEIYNLDLSKKRVETVKDFMVQQGIPARIIKTQYAGESQPLESHPDGEESQINRRVEILIIPMDNR